MWFRISGTTIRMVQLQSRRRARSGAPPRNARPHRCECEPSGAFAERRARKRGVAVVQKRARQLLRRLATRPWGVKVGGGGSRACRAHGTAIACAPRGAARRDDGVRREARRAAHATRGAALVHRRVPRRVGARGGGPRQHGAQAGPQAAHGSAGVGERSRVAHRGRGIEKYRKAALRERTRAGRAGRRAHRAGEVARSCGARAAHPEGAQRRGAQFRRRAVHSAR